MLCYAIIQTSKSVRNNLTSSNCLASSRAFAAAARSLAISSCSATICITVLTLPLPLPLHDKYLLTAVEVFLLKFISLVFIIVLNATTPEKERRVATDTNVIVLLVIVSVLVQLVIMQYSALCLFVCTSFAFVLFQQTQN
jgi:hypothetical protein